MINQNNKNSVHGVIDLTESFLCFSLNPSLLSTFIPFLGAKFSQELIFPFFYNSSLLLPIIISILLWHDVVTISHFPISKYQK